MNLRQKNFALFLMMGIIVTGLPVVAACSLHCAAGGPDVSMPPSFYCTLLSHSFVQSEVFILVFYIALLMDFYLIGKSLILPAGFAAILFKPPRFFLNNPLEYA